MKLITIILVIVFSQNLFADNTRIASVDINVTKLKSISKLALYNGNEIANYVFTIC